MITKREIIAAGVKAGAVGVLFLVSNEHLH